MSATICNDLAPLRFVEVQHDGARWASVRSLCQELGLDLADRVADLEQNRGHWATPLDLPAYGPCIPIEQVPFFLVCVEREDVTPEKVAMLDAVHRRIAEVCSSGPMRAVTKELLADLGVPAANRAALQTAGRLVAEAIRTMRRTDNGPEAA